MNKKSLLNLAMCSLLLGSMPMGLVGCKDYDGDIKDLNTTTGDLSSQISSLKTALETAQNAATAAANDAKAAADKADKATEEVALAKKAAEEAKAEAIAAAIAEVEKLQSQMSDMNAETAKDLAALAGRIDGIEAGLNKIDLTKVDEMLGGLSTQIQEANKQISAINVQIAALENLKTEVPAMKTSIDALTKELNAVKAKAEANTTSINEIKGELATISSKISAGVTNAVNTIAGILAQRLTSVTLMPEYYVEGIPSIVFESLNYTKLEKKEVKEGDRTIYSWVADASKPENKFNIVGSSTQAKYRLNPGTLVASDIDIEGMGFVSQVAQTRAGEDFNKVIAVEKAEIGANGVMTLNLKKVIDDINTPDENNDSKFYTVSLKVPVAKKHLFENETEAAVYSEFARVNEVSGSAGLIRIAKPTNLSLNDSAQAYDRDVNVLNVPYNSSLDLNTIIKASINVTETGKNGNIIDDLAAYGLSIKYAKAAEPYLIGTNNTDQQAYAKIEGSTLTPITPSGSTDNKSIIGRTPIIRVMLVDDVNKNMVAVEYLKVKYVGDIAAVTLPEIAFESNPASPYNPEYVMPWDVFAKNVLEKLNNGQGMSKNDFQSIYLPGNGSWDIVVPQENNTDKWSKPTFSTDTYADQTTGVIKWTMASKYLGVLGFGANDPRVYTATVTFKNKLGQYPDVIVPLKWTITPNAAQPQFAAFNSNIWSANNTLLVTVVQKSASVTSAKYDTNIIVGRNEQNIFSNWEALKPLDKGAQYSYYLVKQDYTNKANEKFEDVTFGKLDNAGISYNYNGLNALPKISYTLKKGNPHDEYIVCNGGTVVVDWYTNINGLGDPMGSNAAAVINAKKFASFNLKVLPILSFNRNTVTTFITDNVLEAQTYDMAGMFTIKDAYNNVVTKNGTNGLWEFYGITNDSPIYGDDVKLSDTATGAGQDLPEGMDVTISGSKLTYRNSMGAALPANKYLIVPVTINHAWGTLTGTVAVQVKKGAAN